MSRRTFRGWIGEYTVPQLVTDISRAGVPISHQAVYMWRRGITYPSPTRIPVILRLANGELRPEDVVRPRHVRPARGRRR